MKHPFERIPTNLRRRIFLPLLVATILIFFSWVLMVSPMSNEKAPLSISSFGMAGTLSNAKEMIASWDYRARLWGVFGIGFDFLQLVVYPTTFAMACAWIAQWFRQMNLYWLSIAGVLIAWGQWLAALFGTIQNAVMMSLLLGSETEIGLKISYWATLFKLILLFLGPFYAACGYLFWTFKGQAKT
jgi:hypothetical protein